MCGSTTIFYGGVINPLDIDSFSALPRCVLCVDPEGNIAWIIDDVEPHNLQEQLAMKGLVDPEIITLRDGEFIIPGFIDTHTVSRQKI
jgi:guanine deaminase